MKNIIEKVNGSFDLAVSFFLFSGSLYFIYYSLSESKSYYLMLSIFIYISSYLFRKTVLKTKYTKGFTEPGLFLISFLLTAYLLYITGIDRNIKNYLPNEILSQSGFAFIFLILIIFISSFKKEFGKFSLIFLMVILLFVINRYSSYSNTLFLENKYIANLIIGFPLIYLISQVFGLTDLLSAKEESSQHPPR